MSDADQVILAGELAHLEYLNSEIERVTQHIAFVARSKEVCLLMTITGRGLLQCLVNSLRDRNCKPVL